MARIERRRDWRAEINVAEPHHEIARIEDDAAYVVDGIEPVHPADELDVARTPGRVLSHRLHIFVDGDSGRRVVPGERQVNDAARYFDVIDRRQLFFGTKQHIQQGAL